ncbi:site-specific integrase [Halomonas sp. SpR1]|uniref:site-specific integrase n=1 Tax=Halomonas sp. SpR1 TaxID=3050462 RepID=UPI0027E50CE3|nr:site-specific integrase [Halomonas sp. SpR1]MDQ7734678.1 site-specific integrase [Halomonas sp. SpR1]
MGKTTAKLTARLLERLASELPEGDEVWDSEFGGYHVRAGKRGLSIRLSYYNSLNKRRVLTIGKFGVYTATQARETARDALAVVAQGGDPRAAIEQSKAEATHQQQQTLRSYLQTDYADHQKRRKDGDATLRRIKNSFGDWLDKPMDTFSLGDVERWQSKKEAGDPDASPPIKPQAYETFKRSYGALQTLLNHAAKRGVITQNPLKDITLQKPALTSDQLEAEEGRRYLENSEREAFFMGLEAYQQEKRAQRRSRRANGRWYLSDLDSFAYVDHAVPWLMLMYYTGFRPGDLFGLRWSQINFEFKSIRKIIEKTAHQSPEPQTFPLSDQAFQVLETWWLQRGKPSSGFVFPSPETGKRLGKDAMRRPWQRIRKLAGLYEGMVLYTLRHNFASQLVMVGVDLLTVSKLMAHTDIQTTIKYYAHLQPDHKRNAVQLFAQIGQGEEDIGD